MGPAAPSDEDDVRKARAGDPAAVQALFERWTPRLRARVRRRLPPSLKGKVAESDVIQEAFLTAFLRMGDFEDRGEGSFGRWLGQILQNKMQDEVRRFLGTGKRDATREAPMAGSGLYGVSAAKDPSPSTAASAKEEHAAVRRAFRALPDADQAVIRHVDEEGLTFAVAGERMSCTEEAARKRYKRAIDRLGIEMARGEPRAAPAAKPQSPAVGRRLGPLRLLSILGEGAMGTVFLAEVEKAMAEAATGRQVAVKVLRPALASRPGFAARFRREAAIGLRVVAPRVVRTLLVGTARVNGVPTPYIVSELLRGRTLRALLAERGAAAPEFVRSLALDVGQALRAIHGEGAIHRDVKPENVMIGESGRATLTDLGLARLLDDVRQVTSSGTFVGSPRYAAPEQFRPRDAKADARTDLYALGMTLFEAATGKHPFPGPNPWAAARIQVSAPPPRIAQSRRGFDPFLDEVVAVLMSPQPEDRFPSAESFLWTLRGGEPSAWWTSRQSTPR